MGWGFFADTFRTSNITQPPSHPGHEEFVILFLDMLFPTNTVSLRYLLAKGVLNFVTPSVTLLSDYGDSV